MTVPLERVLTFSRNTTPAASLPLELQQQIFSYLDNQAFHAARNVCRWWRLSSSHATSLARQLQHMPIKPQVHARTTAPEELERVYLEAAQKLPLSLRVREDTSSATALAPAHPLSGLIFPRPQIPEISRGKRTVTINSGQLTLFDTTKEVAEVILQRKLESAVNGAARIPWLGIAPRSDYALALSEDCNLLAVAQERTITIYDLTSGPEAETVSRTLASAAGHYICGLDFEQNDRALRVQLSGKCSVVYLGTPLLEQAATACGGIEYWRSTAGLRHTFLDSSLLSTQTSKADEQHSSRLSGLQLLRPHANGFLFASQHHGGDESSYYVYGHLRCSQPTETLPIAAEPESVTVLARLESYLSAWDYLPDHHAKSGMGSWGDMPCAHEHHPRSALSEDGGLLVLGEREKKHVRHAKWTQLFVYRVPALQGLLATRTGHAELSQAMDVDHAHALPDVKAESEAVAERQKHIVARVPLAIGTLPGEVQEMRFSMFGGHNGRQCPGLTVITTETGRRWELTET